MSRAQRDRGARFEREVVDAAKAAGYPLAARTSDGRHQRTRGDIAGVPGVSIECKRTEKFSIRQAWAQALEQAAATDLPVVVTRWDHGPALAVLPLDELLALLKHREVS
jgi:hypothetical protein